MKIHDKNNLNQLIPAQKDPALEHPTSSRTKETQSGGDKAQLSALSRRIGRAKEVADTLPGVRTDRIALARHRLASGYYDSPEAKTALVARLADLIRETS